jgi:hypothetical protein
MGAEDARLWKLNQTSMGARAVFFYVLTFQETPGAGPKDCADFWNIFWELQTIALFVPGDVKPDSPRECSAIKLVLTATHRCSELLWNRQKDKNLIDRFRVQIIWTFFLACHDFFPRPCSLFKSYLHFHGGRTRNKNRYLKSEAHS